MEEDHLTTPARIITYGSIIHMNLEDNFNYFIYGEGFTDNKL